MCLGHMPRPIAWATCLGQMAEQKYTSVLFDFQQQLTTKRVRETCKGIYTARVHTP